ncbi:uncharacterized protein LOC131228936 [Magnolia sinica]|uniref:uncharacterized protein LOC131228936 n=1 Tax=Magnolia sinica TaxID=86752 RepID=UPI00265B1428|nr:uncharacterized protein LOC131228936 [Magnolia sinica]
MTLSVSNPRPGPPPPPAQIERALLAFHYASSSLKLQLSYSRKWDIQDGNHLYHPNIQTASDPQAVIDFINKEGDILEEGIYQQQIKGSSNSTNEIWAEILRTSNSASEFLDQCKRLQPKVFFTKLSALQHFANYEWPPIAEVYVSPYCDFPRLSNTLHEWQLKNVCCFRRPHRPMSLILEGPTGIGKTLWARSLAPHNYFSGRMDFRSYSNDAYYNIIDNISFKHCLHKKELLGARHDWTANVRYGKQIKIKGGIPCIILGPGLSGIG